MKTLSFLSLTACLSSNTLLGIDPKMRELLRPLVTYQRPTPLSSEIETKEVETTSSEQLQEDKADATTETLNVIPATPSLIPSAVYKYIARYYYGIKPHVVVFDVNGVLLDFAGKLIPQGVNLLQKCARAGHTIMILSNGGLSTLGELYLAGHDEILTFIKQEHLLFSGITRKIKPSNAAYQHLRTIVAQDTNDAHTNICFIDDTKANITAAQRNGIHGLHLDTSKGYEAAYSNVEKQLQQLGVL